MPPEFLAGLRARLPMSDKTKSDVLWNAGSSAFAGLAGIAMVLIISKRFGAVHLGLFNLTYAIYIILSQLSVGGVHFSVLKSVAQYADDDPRIESIMTSAIAVTVIISLCVMAVALPLRNLLAGLFRKPGLALSLLQVIPGLFFFSLNKLFSAFFNARREIRTFAVLQAFRYLFLLAATIVLALSSFDGERISLIFTISEFCLFLVSLAFSLPRIGFGFNRIEPSWIREHARYGFRASIGNLFTEINTKTDILVLGLFSTSKIIGIYSFPSMLVDGLNQIPVVLRTVINPILTSHKFQRGDAELQKLVEKGKALAFKVLVPLGLLAIPAYVLSIPVFSLNAEFRQGLLPFVILLAGCLASSGYRPFFMILNQTGFPGHQSILFFLIFLTNLVGNLLLVPLYGMIGAAVGTSLSFAASVVYLKRLVRKTNGIRI